MKLRSFLLLGAALLSLGAGPGVTAVRASDFADAVHDVENRLDDAALDVQAGTPPPSEPGTPPEDALEDALKAFWPSIKDPASLALFDSPVVPESERGRPDAEYVGVVRAILQHAIALEMLRVQRAGQLAETREWRALITLPRYASGEENALLLQNVDPAQANQPAIAKALARECIGWQTARARQLLDHLQEGLKRGDANAAFVELYTSEIRALVQFPAALLTAAELPTAARKPTRAPKLTEPFDSPEDSQAIALWRQEVEGTLPNLLSDKDVSRLERLLARFVKLIPQEYRNGVANGHVLIALEYREATQFSQQAQSLVNELGPVWQRDQADAYNKRHRELVDKFETLRRTIAVKAPVEEVVAQTKAISDILEGDFRLSARRAGDKTNIIEETALEARAALNNSLAAAKADQWQEAESQRLDAYTNFDAEIEPRVLPRDPDLGRNVERGFIDGTPEAPGIKALLDRRAPMDELEAAYERTLAGMDNSVSLLKTAVSPGTLAFTAFSIIAREGMEAVVVLAALLAGLRGAEQAGTRRGIVGGAWLGVGVSAITFWLSKTLVQSLSRYGEKLEAIVSILAVCILLIVTNWVFHKFYWVGWNAKIRSLSKAAQGVDKRRWESLALLGVGFLTVYREGFESALFLQSLILDGNPVAVWGGVAAGAAFIGLVGGLTFKFGVKLPYRKLLVVTGVLVVSIMVSFLGSTTRLFQTVGWLPVHPVPGLHLPNWTGLWLGLYPSWEGLLIPPLALVYVGGAWLWTKWQSARNQQAPSGPSRRPAPARRQAEPEPAGV